MLYQRDINEAATNNRQESENLGRGFQGQRLKVKVLQGKLYVSSCMIYLTWQKYLSCEIGC